MTWRQFRRLLVPIAQRYGYESQGSPYSRSDDGSPADIVAADRGRAESLLHEICHGVLLGLSDEELSTSAGSDDIGNVLKTWPPAEADVQEVRTCACEILVARRFGLRIGLRTLADYAQGAAQLVESPQQMLSLIERDLERPDATADAERIVRWIEAQREAA